MLGDDIAAGLVELRAQAVSLMVDRCDIERAVTAWDEGEQASVTTWTVVHADVPCALDIPPATGRSLVADEASTVESPQVKIPVEYVGVQPDDRVTVAGVGVVWVTHVPVRTYQVQRRLECRWVQ